MTGMGRQILEEHHLIYSYAESVVKHMAPSISQYHFFLPIAQLYWKPPKHHAMDIMYQKITTITAPLTLSANVHMQCVMQQAKP